LFEFSVASRQTTRACRLDPFLGIPLDELFQPLAVAVVDGLLFALDVAHPASPLAERGLQLRIGARIDILVLKGLAELRKRLNRADQGDSKTSDGKANQHTLHG